MIIYTYIGLNNNNNTQSGAETHPSAAPKFETKKKIFKKCLVSPAPPYDVILCVCVGCCWTRFRVT